MTTQFTDYLQGDWSLHPSVGRPSAFGEDGILREMAMP
jgi:hypothetical protein